MVCETDQPLKITFCNGKRRHRTSTRGRRIEVWKVNSLVDFSAKCSRYNEPTNNRAAVMVKAAMQSTDVGWRRQGPFNPFDSVFLLVHRPAANTSAGIPPLSVHCVLGACCCISHHIPESFYWTVYVIKTQDPSGKSPPYTSSSFSQHVLFILTRLITSFAVALFKFVF